MRCQCASDQIGLWCGSRQAASGSQSGKSTQSSNRELPLVIVMVTLGRNSDFFLRASKPVCATTEQGARRLLILTQLVEIRPESGRVEFKPDSTEVAEGNGDKCQWRVHRCILSCACSTSRNLLDDTCAS